MRLLNPQPPISRPPRPSPSSALSFSPQRRRAGWVEMSYRVNSPHPGQPAAQSLILSVTEFCFSPTDSNILQQSFKGPFLSHISHVAQGHQNQKLHHRTAHRPLASPSQCWLDQSGPEEGLGPLGSVLNTDTAKVCEGTSTGLVFPP